MKKALLILIYFLFVNVVSAAPIATLPEDFSIKPIKSYAATITNLHNKYVLGHLSIADIDDQVNYVYTDTQSQQKITFTLEQHFGEANAFLFQIFDDNQTRIGKLAISDTSNMLFKGFELYGPDEDISQILSRQANPLITEPSAIFSNNFKVYNYKNQILATLSGRAGLLEIKLNKDNLAKESFIVNNPQNTDLLLAIFAMQSLEFIQKTL
ncbi:MAG: hypothetical protein NXI01_05810 [Gammaproteobacteria bacterium]|nr:hypothetical protein [Gammaproteobacteria bacterium]